MNRFLWYWYVDERVQFCSYPGSRCLMISFAHNSTQDNFCFCYRELCCTLNLFHNVSLLFTYSVIIIKTVALLGNASLTQTATILLYLFEPSHALLSPQCWSSSIHILSSVSHLAVACLTHMSELNTRVQYVGRIKNNWFVSVFLSNPMNFTTFNIAVKSHIEKCEYNKKLKKICVCVSLTLFKFKFSFLCYPVLLVYSQSLLPKDYPN